MSRDQAPEVAETRAHDCVLMNCLGRLEALEDRVDRIAMREHRHVDEPDGRQAAYVEGYQAGFAAARNEVESLVLTMGNKPIPAQSDGSPDG